jgi:hypothetical protein
MRIAVTNEVSPAWSISVSEPWLTVKPAKGRLAGGSQLITLEAEASRLPIGSYEATVVFRVDSVCQSIPVRLYVTDIQPGQAIDATAEQGKGTAWAAGIRLESAVKMTAETLDSPMSIPGPGQTGLDYSEGDRVILVSGSIANDTDKEWQIDYWPDGFDAEGNQVARGLDMSGVPLPGHLQMNIPAHSSRPFTLHMTWSEGIERVTIGANKYDLLPALP